MVAGTATFKKAGPQVRESRALRSFWKPLVKGSRFAEKPSALSPKPKPKGFQTLNPKPLNP